MANDGITSLFSTLVLAYVELALELHDNKSLDKNALANRLLSDRDRPDLNLDEISKSLLSHMAKGLSDANGSRS